MADFLDREIVDPVRDGLLLVDENLVALSASGGRDG
jgi:hypothetical protein